MNTKYKKTIILFLLSTNIFISSHIFAFTTFSNNISNSENLLVREISPSSKKKKTRDQSKKLKKNEIKFCFWNLKNYLTESRTFKINKKTIENVPYRYIPFNPNKKSNPNKEKDKSKERLYSINKKKQKSTDQIIKTLKAINPHILSVCEIGNLKDVKDLANNLKKKGIYYPHILYNDTTSSSRRIAIFSKFPIDDNNSRNYIPYKINGQAFLMRRGILDATIKVSPKSKFRFIGVHLKSKLSTNKPITEEMIRINEATITKKHIVDILKKNKNEKIILFGDFNSTKNEKPIKIIKGKHKTPYYLGDIYLKDKFKNSWTHYWNSADHYSRIDYIFFSNSAKKNIKKQKSYIFYDPNFLESSDHRPLVACLTKD